MELIDDNKKQIKDEIQLLNRKRNKNKSSNKNKENKNNNKNNSNNETTLEIISLSEKNNLNNFMDEENNEFYENNDTIKDKINIKENNELLLLIKKTNINFNTPETLFIKGRKNPDSFPEEEKFNQYYVQRYYFFSLFDEGIQMDKESWYSVTPEEISEYISSIIPDSSESTILDAFCGCGGNVIYLSKKFNKVIANDLFIEKINMTKNNTKIYDCPNNIEYHAEDFLKLNLNGEKINYVFLSPPWGGPEYKNDGVYSLKKWITPDIDKIIQKSFKMSKNIILYLPRNTDLKELANIIYKYDKEEIDSFSNTILFDVKYLKSASKIKAILVLYGPKFNKMKVKLIKQYIIDSIFKKKSNKINQNKLKKQLNLFKIVGYNEYIRNLLNYKEVMKDFSGNIFLENLEKFFIENVLDEEGKIEYENMNKKEDEYNIKNININSINNKKESNIIEEEKQQINNKFFDLRNILSEDTFNQIKKEVFYNEN